MWKTLPRINHFRPSFFSVSIFIAMNSPSPSISFFSPISSSHNYRLCQYQSHCPSPSAFKNKPCETSSTFSPATTVLEATFYLDSSTTTTTTTTTPTTTPTTTNTVQPSVSPPSPEDTLDSLSRRPLNLPHTCFKHLLSFQPQSWTSLTSSSPALLPRLLGRISHPLSPDRPPYHPQDLSTRSFPLHPPPPPPRSRQPLLQQLRLVLKNRPLEALPHPKLPFLLPLGPRVNDLRHSHRILLLLQPRSSQNGPSRKMS